MNSSRAHAFAAEVVNEPVSATLGATEAQRLGRACDDGGAHLCLVELVHLQESVLHLLNRDLLRLYVVQDRVPEVSADDLVDCRIQRRGEEQRLAFNGHEPEQPFHLRQEAHVRHAIRLVDDESRDLAESDRFTVRQVDEPARSRDDDVGAFGELAGLAIEVGAAVDREHPPVNCLRENLEHVGDLNRELARRYEDERRRCAGSGARSSHEHGQAECERLARAGLRLAAHVTTRQRVLDRKFLYGKGAPDALAFQRLDQFGRNTETRECGPDFRIRRHVLPRCLRQGYWRYQLARFIAGSAIM